MPPIYDVACDDDLSALVRLFVEAYHCPAEDTAAELRRLGLAEFRVLRDGPAIAGGLDLISVGQWFGGHCLPCGAVAWVAVSLAQRGGGLARQLMTAALEEMHRRGMALSCLLASTAALYRQVGYEQAGGLVRYELPLAARFPRGHDGEVVAVDAPDDPQILAIDAALGPVLNGVLRRDTAFWHERFDPLRGRALRSYVIRNDGQPEGYVIFAHGIDGRLLRVRDAAFTTIRAGRRILGLLANHALHFERACWWGGERDRLCQLLPEPLAVPYPHSPWMLRLVDVPAALAGRGYAPQVTAEVHLDVRDTTLPANAGRWVFRVAGGQGSLERGGSGAVAIDVAGLAALYSGYADPPLLALRQQIEGPAEAQAALAACFAGGCPLLTDYF